MKFLWKQGVHAKLKLENPLEEGRFGDRCMWEENINN
jgi:hypothetical protein